MSFRLRTRLLPPVVGLLGLFFLALPLLAASGDDNDPPRAESHKLTFVTEDGRRMEIWVLIDTSERPADETLAGVAEDVEQRTGAVLLNKPEVGAAFTVFGLWAEADIPVPVTYNDDFDPLGIDGRAAVLSQMATWNAVPDQDFSFSDGGTSTTLHSICDSVTEDGINNVVFDDELAIDVLAWVCTLDLPDVIDSFDEFDMQISLDFTWSADPVTLPGEMDLQTVVLHELGHAAGIDHTMVFGAVMFPSVASGTQIRVLTLDDIHALQFLYGDFVPTPTETPTFTPTIRLVDLPTITPTLTGNATATATATVAPTVDAPFEAWLPGVRRE